MLLEVQQCQHRQLDFPIVQIFILFQVRCSYCDSHATRELTGNFYSNATVCGGHAGVTILPLLSQSIPALPASLFADQTKLDALVKRIQFGGDEVVAAKAGAGSATLSMAYGKSYSIFLSRTSEGITVKDNIGI